jgi:endoglucanase
MESDLMQHSQKSMMCKTRIQNAAWAKAHPTYLLAITILTIIASFSGFSFGQEAIGINFFDPANSGNSSPTCWDDPKSYVYMNPTATFTRCNTNSVPVNTASGTQALVFTTTNPVGSYWNVQFKLDWGHSINFLRYGQSETEYPWMHLRVKWGAIAAGADVQIGLIDNQYIKNKYFLYNGSGQTYSDQTAFVALSNYVTPSTTTWQDVYIPMEDFLASNPNLDLTRIGIIVIGGAGYYNTTNTMYISKMRLIRSPTDNQYTDMIKVNQIGYLPNQKKLAIISYETGAVSTAPSTFQVKDATSGAVVYSGSVVKKTGADDLSGDTVYQADFSGFTTPGRYVVYCPQIDKTSLPFDIRKNVFDEAFRDSLRFFYFARSGQEIAEPYAEGHTRPAIYNNNSACSYDYNPSVTRNVQGGWFDAGDLHMDVHNNVVTLWMLMQTMEKFNSKLGANVLNLPESDGQTNDMVLLIKYGLDWLKKMQNADGSVHFIVYALVSDTERHQHISNTSTGSACVLAGTFAKAYTLFSTIPG